MMGNKRGLSEVVSTVLVIMLTISAIAILAGFLVPFVRNSLNKGTECTSYGEFYSFDESFNYNCYNITTGNNIYLLSIKKSSDRALENNSDELRIVFKTKSGEQKTLTVKNGGASSNLAGSILVAGENNNNLRVPRAGGTLTYIYNGSTESYESAEVYSVLRSGRICEQKDFINLRKC
jgi:flagellin-like protein